MDPLRRSSNTPAQVILLVTIAVTPLCLLPGVFLSHDVIPKVIATLFGAAALLFFLPHWSGGLRALSTYRQGRWFLALAISQVCSLLLSMLFSGQPALSLAGTVWRRFGAVEQIAVLLLATAAVSVAILSNSWITSLFRWVSIAGGFGATYGIAQYFGIDPFLDPALYKIDYFGGIVRPPATMGHAIYFAAWLVPVTLVAASAAIDETNKNWRRLHGAVAVLACIAILLSGTRGAVLALLGGAALVHSRRWRMRKVAIVAAALTASLLLFVVSPAGTPLRNRFFQWRQDLGGPRALMWRESPALAFHHPFLGIGPETFGVEFRKIESAEMSRAYPDYYHETPHNAVLDAAIAQGIPGLIVLLSVFALGFAAKHAGIQAAMLGIFISSLFASLTIVESIFLWTLTGIAIALLAPKSAQSSKPLPRWTLAIAAVAGLMFIAVALLLAIPDAADQRVKDAVARNDFAAAAEAYDSAISWSYELPGYELFLSRQMSISARALGNTPEAAKAWRKATEASDLAERRGEERFSAAYQSSVLAIVSGDIARAEREAREAAQLAPNWHKPHVLLGQILSATGRATEGAAEQHLALSLGAPKN